MNSSNMSFFELRALEYPEGPSHYLNKWQDKYAFELRTRILESKYSFQGKYVLEVGCGDGQISEFLLYRNVKTLVSIDQSPCMVRLCRKRLFASDFNNWSTAREGIDVFNYSWFNSFDVVLMATMYHCLDYSIRQCALSNAYKYLNKNGDLLVLDYLPFKVPKYQKDLSYKFVDDYRSSIKQITDCGFRLRACWDISFVDSKLFHFFGKNLMTYAITKFLDINFTKTIPTRLCKYRLLLFSK